MAVADYFVPIIIGAFLQAMVNSSRIRDAEETHQKHTHAADGSINGIRGWY